VEDGAARRWSIREQAGRGRDVLRSVFSSSISSPTCDVSDKCGDGEMKDARLTRHCASFAFGILSS
jgi:hypothetical protein